MNDATDDARANSRSHLLPEEKAAGESDNAKRQARIMLEDSDARTDDPEGTKDQSVQTPDETGA